MPSAASHLTLGVVFFERMDSGDEITRTNRLCFHVTHSSRDETVQSIVPIAVRFSSSFVT